MEKLSAYSDDIKRVNIIGVPISAVNLDITLQCIQTDLRTIKEQGGYICVSNVHTTVMAHDDEKYFNVQAKSYLSVPDGMPLVLIGRKTFKQMDRVAGLDLMKAIFELSKTKHYKHFFYGNTESNLKLFIQKVRQNYPWVDIVGFESSVFRDLTIQEKIDLAKRINEIETDFVWVSLGAPIQEFFCEEMKRKVCALMIGVGGVFNIVAGIVPDAPKWMKKSCLEWLFRLILEPKRLFKRYLIGNMRYIYYLIKERMERHKVRL